MRAETPATGATELLTPKEMAEVDRLSVEAGKPISTLMENAGYAVADAVAARSALGVSIVVVAGPGNNGGDAFVAARVLRERGYRVAVVDLAGEGGTGAAAAARAHCRVERIAADDPRLARADVVIDGLFGAGLSRDVEGEFATLVERINAGQARVVAVDIASGVDGTTGEVRGVAVRAHETVTFGRRKPGHLLYPGRAHAGRVRLADIGLSEAAIASIAARCFANEPELWLSHRPRLDAAGHKYHRGHALVVSGPMTATGAARLAAHAALRAGAGLVTLASPADALLVNACHLTTVMLEKADGPQELSDLLAERRRNAVCLGMGLPPTGETRALAEAALASEAAAVLDAGAVVAFAGDADGLARAVRSPCVLTPHEGEFSRVFPAHGDKLERARRAAEASGAVVVLKGPDTVIAAPDGRAAINWTAPPTLATAGAGDVLGGIVTAFLAQGVSTFEAAAMAVWLHGEAGRLAGHALVADDILQALKPARSALDEI
jgi:hydroxyethylthiazole kinase-like uncharacterized protein yjeF